APGGSGTSLLARPYHRCYIACMQYRSGASRHTLQAPPLDSYAMSQTGTRTAIEPFRALRYDPSKVDLARVVAPPYDVISPTQREALIAGDDHSVVRLELPDSNQGAADLLHRWTQDGTLTRETEPGLWWHEQRFVGPDGVERE